MPEAEKSNSLSYVPPAYPNTHIHRETSMSSAGYVIERCVGPNGRWWLGWEKTHFEILSLAGRIKGASVCTAVCEALRSRSFKLL